jgi:hypothetical protein
MLLKLSSPALAVLADLVLGSRRLVVTAVSTLHHVGLHGRVHIPLFLEHSCTSLKAFNKLKRLLVIIVKLTGSRNLDRNVSCDFYGWILR